VSRLLIYFFLMLVTGASAQKMNLLPDTIPLCTGDTASIEIRPDPSHTSIQWITPSGVFSGMRRIHAGREGRYVIRIRTTQGATVSDSSFIRLFAPPKRHVTDTVICRSRGMVQLDAGNPGMRYLWSNGENGQRVQIATPGRYYVKIVNGKCSRIDTVRVKWWPALSPVVPSETVFCLSDEGKSLTARNAGWPLIWNAGSAAPVLPVTREGIYSIRMDHPGCGIYRDSVKVRFKACDCEMIIPNSFTPNEDNRNDYFFPVLQCEYTYFNISITDRWGNTVYASNNPAGKWDGRYKGNLCPEDLYIYRIESTEKTSDKKSVRSGQISLFR
jgi:gliding motility-associated-like protein